MYTYFDRSVGGGSGVGGYYNVVSNSSQRLALSGLPDGGVVKQSNNGLFYIYNLESSGYDLLSYMSYLSANPNPLTEEPIEGQLNIRVVSGVATHWKYSVSTGWEQMI